MKYHALLLPLVLASSTFAPALNGQETQALLAGKPDGGTVDSEASSTPGSLMALMEAELAYAMKNLVAVDGTRPYFISYTVYDEQTAVVRARLGALNQSLQNDNRNLNIDVRVGDYSLDNTHQIRGSDMPFAHGNGNIALALDGDPESIRRALWLGTDRAFKRAVQRFARIRTNLKVNVDEQDQSDDFSREPPQVHFDAPVQRTLNRSEWEARIRKVSAIARNFPLIYGSSVTLGTFAGTRYQVDSEGGRLRTAGRRCRITLTASSKAEDGMDLQQTVTLNARTLDRLPGTEKIEAAFRGVIEQVLALRDAPLAEPYSGPAIMHNRASAVFFHEIFGHRIEGHRQRDVTEGQTFTKKIEERILPDFISIYDDPTTPRLGDIDLRGYYLFDDEGVPSSRVSLVEKGILKSFLMCRRPVEGFPRSTGHGRRQPGRTIAARQGNLIVGSSRRVPFERLRDMLIEECKRQGKPYGLRFEDISGGFTTTSRRGAQMFKVLPIVVYRVYADGRPDELIRGADVVGTPLSSLEKILCTADDPAVFNGSCGAESGWVPVSAISPSILVSTIEIEKRTHAQGRPPILAPPLGLPDQTALVGEDQDTIMQAMADELQRAMDGLTLDDLPKPYFIQFRADDRQIFSAQAYHGGLTRSDERRARSFRSRVRVGSYDSDNTNVGGGGGGASLPLDDDDSALRHAIWAAVDRDYKRAVEVLTRKQAYLRDKNMEDRPHDFSAAPSVQWLDPPARLSFDRKGWEDHLKELSARFREFPQILDSAVSIFAGTSNEYVVNTEGTRLRVGDTGALLTIDAALQAEEGMWLRDGRTFLAEKPQELPTLDELRAAIDELCKNLITLSRAPMCDHYAGPVLFEPVAAGKMFAALLGDGLCARPVPLGRKAAPDMSLENKLGLRILPRSFQVYDDPRDRTFNGTLLAGAYEYDDEAVRAERVSLVEDGILKNFLSSRSPTKEVAGSNGHGRSGGLGDARARVGCLYFFAENGVSPEQLKHRLIEAAREEGLAFGLRIKSLEDGAHGILGKPIYAYKVYVDDGREELVRGLEFLSVETRALKHILAGGTQREVYNATASVVTSFISPSVILEDLELSQLQKEFNKLPILKAPDARN